MSFMKKSDYDGKYPGNLNLYLKGDAWVVYKQYQCNFIPQSSLFQRVFEIFVFWWNSLCLSLFQNKHFVLIYFHMVFFNVFAFKNKIAFF